MPPLGLLVFVTGTSSLGSEIAAARLLAPYFGDSTIIWANTIGVVLVALSVGYWIGGGGGGAPPRGPPPRPFPAPAHRGGAAGDRAVPGAPVPRARRRRARYRRRRRVRRLARRGARPRGDAGARAGHGVAVRDPPGAGGDRRRREDDGAPLRDLDPRVARGDVPQRAAAHPACRDAADVPGLRARAR